MKTFLGFTTGLLSGTMIGMVFMSILLLASKDLREYVDTVADNIDDA